MSIQVNDFRWEPGKNDAEYIKLLESSRDEWQKIAQKAIAKLKALSKAQKTSLEEVAADHGLAVDGVSFALNQYQTIICEITHGMMSKLSYHAKDILQVAQERWCDTCELKEAQEPVKPKVIDTSNSKTYHNDMFKNYYCGNCGEFLHIVNRKDLFCSQCGRAVKWDG